MKLAMIGTGYVGLVTGACFADFGNDVTCVDIDEEKVKQLKKGKVPFYEQGLEDVVERNVREGRLKFTTDTEEAVQNSEVIFICVGTPESKDGSADLTYILDAAEDIGNAMEEYKVIVMKSTVPVGTNEKVRREVREHVADDVDFDVVSNPEFMREGAAVKDFQNPDRVVIGARSEKAEKIMTRLYRHVARVNRPIMTTDPETAEIIKYASNSMLATRISFMNELSHLTEKVDADIKEVAKGIGLDDRIGPRFLQAGAGYGGSCFPKDVRALAHTMERNGVDSNLLRAVDYINEKQKKSLVPKLKEFVPDLDGKKIAVWGLSFKPRTSDTRRAPAIDVINQLEDEYAEVVGFDPEAMEEMEERFPDIEYADTPYDALKDAHGVILCTEWDEFREPDFERMKELMAEPVVIDGRNIYDPELMEELGFEYQSVGR